MLCSFNDALDDLPEWLGGYLAQGTSASKTMCMLSPLCVSLLVGCISPSRSASWAQGWEQEVSAGSCFNSWLQKEDGARPFTGSIYNVPEKVSNWAGLGHMPIFGPNMMCKEIPCWPELGHMSITVTKGMCDVCVMSVTNQLWLAVGATWCGKMVERAVVFPK